MTDDEILLALDCCDYEMCEDCPYIEVSACQYKLCRDAFNLINRQKAEIERLQGKVEELSEVLSDTIKIRYKEARTEAVKEFAERLKDEVTYYEDTCGNFVPFVDCRDIDNLVKEMVGDESD